MSLARQTLSLLLAAVLLVSASSLYAGEPEMSDEEVAERLGFLSNALERGKVYSNIWWWGWTVGQFTAAAVFGTLAYTLRDEPGATANNVVSAVQSFAGGFILAVDPLDAAFLPRKIRMMPDSTADERRAKLTAAEAALRDSDAWERLGRHWIGHILGFAMGAVGFALLTEAFHDTDWKDGLFNFIFTVGMNELMIWTQPVFAINDLEAYDARFNGVKPGPKVSFAGGLGGARLTISY